MAAKSSIKVNEFVHLHNHTQYSLLDGLTKVPALLDRVAELGMNAVAITDHGTLSGLIECYKEARTRDIKPILGIEAYVAPRTLHDKDPSKDKNYYHLILLAMNNTGYQNLMRLSTIANLEGYYYKPRIDHELLEKYNEGLIVLSGCIGGEVGDALRQDQYEQARSIAQWYKQVFGDRYYLEVQDHGHPKHPSAWTDQIKITELTLKLAAELKIPAVLTSDAHYLRHQDQDAHEILLCVQTGSFLADDKRLTLKNIELHVTDPKDIIKRWGGSHPELIRNTQAIAKRCEVSIELGQYLIPKFPVPKGETEKSYMDNLTYRGLVQRYHSSQPKNIDKLSTAELKKLLTKTVRERASYELEVINRMGFNGYFLIVQDFITWGKDQGIVFGPGRGSGAGSIVAYGLRITELDPLAYDLLFERFLNPDRISMPDFDIDIQDSRRDEVIQYCIQKYGEDRVANIVTFGRMAARNAVRDVSRVLQVPYAQADRWAKMIPLPIQGRHTPLSETLKTNKELKTEYAENEEAKRVFDFAIQLEGTIRSHGVHAAGVVIAPDEIVKFTPLEKAQKGVIATQYSMGPIDDLGLLKIDFLGLSNLTIIKNALRIVKKVYGIDLEVNDIPLDDARTFELLSRGDTTGVFQLESSGMKRYLKQLKPTLFEDIISMVALYRPGPMQWIDDFIDRKHGRKPITYIHPAVEPALKNTYGVIVTQEQVMQISKDMCGFSGGQADSLRKAIGKKIPEAMKKLKAEFIEGAIKNVGADRALMEKFWKQLEEFAAYCFNKAHSACYAMIAYWTAYLKANYPAAFMAALMTSDFDNTDRLAIEITECKHLGIEVLPPDINESFVEFGVVPSKKQIRFGLVAIKNVGSGAVEEILRAREGQPFADLTDFFSRVSSRIVNRKTLESLIKAGAFDQFERRGLLLHNLDVLVVYANRIQKQAASGQTDLFGSVDNGSLTVKPTLHLEEPSKESTLAEQLAWERELLGIYLSQHPLDAYQDLLDSQATPLNALKPEDEGKTVRIGGSIHDVREIVTKKGQKMAFVKIMDHLGEIELVLFPGVYQSTTELWERDNVIIASGKLTTRDKAGGEAGDIKILVDRAEHISKYQTTTQQTKTINGVEDSMLASDPSQLLDRRVYLRLKHGDDHQMLLALKEVIDQYKGRTEVVLVLGDDDNKQVIRLPMRVAAETNVLDQLKLVVGHQNVKLS